MKILLLPTLLIFTASLALAGSKSQSLDLYPAEFWFEDNNMRRAGGYPPDFEQMFREPESWARLRSIIDVYYIRGNTLKNLCSDLGEDFVRNHFVKVLNESGISIAIDNLSNWEQNLALLEEYGAKVTAITMQSTLSKRVNHRTENVEDVLDQRIKQVVEDLASVHKSYPELRIGIIDALPTKGVKYKEAYRKLVDELDAKGLKLAYIHLDCPVDIAQQGVYIDWQGVKEVEQFVKEDLGLEYGFICTSNGGGMESDQLFYENVLKIPEAYPVAGGLPDHFIMMSWYPHPSRSLPEDAPEGRYPMTKTALDLATRLHRMVPSSEKIDP